MAAIVLLLVLLRGICDGQAPAQAQSEQKPAKVEGRVIHASSGEPVRKATLTLRPAAMSPGVLAPVHSVSSDAEGKFAFEKVEPGTYRLSAERQGFLRQDYGARQPFAAGTALRLGPGDALTGLEYKLTPHGVLAGKVVDEDGEPVDHAFVNIMRWGFNRGRRQLMPMNGSSANDIGEFRIAGLGPGKYFIAVRAQSFMQRSAAAGEPRQTEGYVTTFYPGVTDASSASAIEIGPGQEHTGLTIRLRKSRVYRITGKVAGLTGDNSRTQVTLSPRDSVTRGFFMGGSAGRIKPDGSFEIPNVTPGSYYVMAMRFDRMPSPAGRAPVEVTNSDVEGIVLTAGSAIPELRGVVKTEGDTPVELKAMQVSMVSSEMLPIGTRPVPVKEDGTFVFEQVAREKFTFYVFPMPESAYLKQVRIGGQDVTKTGLDLTNAESGPAVEVILSSKAATVEGVVTRAKPEDPPGNVVLLPEPWIPDEPMAMNQVFRPGLVVDQTGRFTIKGVAPGKYRLYAFEEFNSQEMMDPDLFKALESKSEALTVGEGEHKTVNPRQIRTAELADRR